MVKNVNAFGVEMDEGIDLAKPRFSIIENGVYDAIIDKLEFALSKETNQPMIVFNYKIIIDKDNIVSFKEWHKLNGSSVIKDGVEIKYEAKIITQLKKIFECWDVPTEYRNLKYFNYLGNAQANLDPAITLMHSFKQYGDVAKKHNSYVKKMMIRVDIGQQPDSKNPQYMRNYIVKFVKLSENSNQILQNNKAEIVEETNPYGVSNTAKDPFDRF